jgi:large subunit ribosomal protein L1
MGKIFKRLKKIDSLIESSNLQTREVSDIDAVIDFMKDKYLECATKFEESVDLALSFKKSAKGKLPQISGTFELPNPVLKKKSIIAFVETEEEAKIAKDLNVDHISVGESLFEKVLSGELNFDICVSTQSAMKPVIKKLAKVLGKRGIMPNQKEGTISKNIADAIKVAQLSKVKFKISKSGTLSAQIGKINFEKSKIIENVTAFTKHIREFKSQNKDLVIGDIFISTTMGRGFKLNNNI